MIVFVLLSYVNVVSATSVNVYQQLAKQVMKTKTVEECSVKKEEFFKCQAQLSSVEREKLCGDFSQLNNIAEGNTATMFKLVTEACLKFSKFH